MLTRALGVLAVFVIGALCGWWAATRPGIVARAGTVASSPAPVTVAVPPADSLAAAGARREATSAEASTAAALARVPPSYEPSPEELAAIGEGPEVVLPDSPRTDAAAAEAPRPAAAAPAPKPLPVATATLLPTPPRGSLLIPVVGVRAAQLRDTFTESRGEGRVHDAIDILAPRGTPVVAVADGRVVKLFTSARGGITAYQFDASERFVYYYAHLDAYAPGLMEGSTLRRGDPVGTVGFSGNADPAAPHLHFGISVLAPDRKWWGGTPVNPYPAFTGR